MVKFDKRLVYIHTLNTEVFQEFMIMYVRMCIMGTSKLMSFRTYVYIMNNGSGS